MNLPENVLEELDRHILGNRKVRGMELLRQATGMSLRDALQALSSRYATLREQRPEDFAQPHEEYWSGFYS